MEVKDSQAQGRHREVGSESRVQAKARADEQEPDRRRERRTSGHEIAKSKSIKGAERKSGGRALKVIELIAGDLPGCSGALPGLGGSQGSSTTGQKSAEGVVPVV
jgi:hypothetical protein